MKIKYIGQREILNFFDLTPAQQDHVRTDHENCEEMQFYINEFDEPEAFDFLRHDTCWTPKRSDSMFKSFDGFKGDSYWSGSLCILNKSCDGFKLFTFVS